MDGGIVREFDLLVIDIIEATTPLMPPLMNRVKTLRERLSEMDASQNRFDLEHAVDSVEQVEEWLRDYHWTVREINRIKKQLEEDFGGPLTPGYGMEAALPKAKGQPSDPTHSEVRRRMKQWERMKALEARCKQIEAAIESIEDEKERAMVKAILDGEKMGLIASNWV